MEECIKRLVKELKPLKVILFRSQIYGTLTKDSDVGILVILDTQLEFAGRRLTASRFFRPRKAPMDFLVLTPEGVHTRLNKWFDPFIRKIFQKGLVLYE